MIDEAMPMAKPQTWLEEALVWAPFAAMGLAFACPFLFLGVMWRSEASPVAVIQRPNNQSAIVHGLAYDLSKGQWPVLAIVASDRKTLTIQGEINVCVAQPDRADQWCMPASALQRVLAQYYELP